MAEKIAEKSSPTTFTEIGIMDVVIGLRVYER